VIRIGWSDFFDFLLDRGGDINARAPPTPPPLLYSVCHKGLVEVDRFVGRGAVLTAALIDLHLECLQHVIKARDQALLDFLLSHGPKLGRFRGLIRTAFKSWCTREFGVTDPDGLFVMVRSLLEHGARGLHHPPVRPGTGQSAPLKSKSPAATPVDIAIETHSINLLRLFDEYGFDRTTVTVVWKPESPEETEVYNFLSEKGAIVDPYFPPFK
jgi:hypothetical protein